MKEMKEMKEMKPEDFFCWWLDNSSNHNLKDDYNLLYKNYARGFREIPYIWNHYSRRFRNLRKINLKGKKLLDVGCGLASEILWCAVQGAECTGLELHSLSYSIAKKRLSILKKMMPLDLTCEVFYQNMLELDEGNKFDIIFLRETFHHLEPRDEIVTKLVNLLAENGRILIEETNGWNPLIQLKYYFIRGTNVVLEKHDKVSGKKYLFGNERITTAENIKKIFLKHNFCSSYQYFRLLPTLVARKKRFARVVEMIEPFLEKIFILKPFFLHYSVELKKKGCPPTH